VTVTHPNAGAARATSSWTLQEDAKLTSAVTNAQKKKYGKEYKTNWEAVAALVPDRTNMQCWSRLNDFLDPNIDQGSGRTCTRTEWTAVVGAGGMISWIPILNEGVGVRVNVALVPGRTNMQCWSRWNDVLDPKIEQRSACTGKWTVVEDIKLKDAVQTHGGENWETIAALVPSRTKCQCRTRWRIILDTDIDPATARAGRWSADEFKKLKDAVLTHGCKDWAAVAKLVPGRTRKQCSSRWYYVLDPSIDRAKGLRDKCAEPVSVTQPNAWVARATGSWTLQEDANLTSGVTNAQKKKYGKDYKTNWEAVAALVPGRTNMQC
jgi:myb proto-oncogene protein